MKETSLGVLKGIISENGGTSTAKTMVPALKELGQVISGGSSGSSSGSSSGGVMVVTATPIAGEDVFTADKTVSEIIEHLEAGGTAVMVLDAGTARKGMLHVGVWDTNEEDPLVLFSGNFGDGETVATIDGSNMFSLDHSSDGK